MGMKENSVRHDGPSQSVLFVSHSSPINVSSAKSIISEYADGPASKTLPISTLEHQQLLLPTLREVRRPTHRHPHALRRMRRVREVHEIGLIIANDRRRVDRVDQRRIERNRTKGRATIARNRHCAIRSLRCTSSTKRTFRWAFRMFAITSPFPTSTSCASSICRSSVALADQETPASSVNQTGSYS